MSSKKTQFIKEFKELIRKEKESNIAISGEITQIDNENISVSLKHPSNLSKNLSVEIDRTPAIITNINNKKIKLKLLKDANFRTNQQITLQNIQKNIIINKLQETLENITDNKINVENEKTLKVIINDVETNFEEKKYNISSKLNENQKIAVLKSLQSEKFYIIQGPPGTGKTHTIIEIIEKLYEENKKILITTHTHVALDNILERLNSINKDEILRLGQRENVSSESLKYTFDEQIKQHELYDEILKKEREIQELKESTIFYEPDSTSLTPKKENIINKFFRRLMPINKNDFEYNNYKRDVSNYKNNERINEIKLEISSIKDNIKTDILSNTKIMASTIISSSSFITKDMEFDYVIMDEASQVPVYLSIIPLMKTNKFIIIGDNKQLQPIANSNASYFLNKSIFNLLLEKYPENYTFLNIQYRMNHEISDIASKLYYGGKLLTGIEVKNRRIELESNTSFLVDDNPITFIDTSNVNFFESNVSGGCCNKYESDLIKSIVKALVKAGISEEDIGIITPYRKQKLYIGKLLQKDALDIECDTIYRFQGREKDIIILSFCKSSDNSLSKFQKKFLNDENQLNVSITRSRKKLIIVADYSMLKDTQNIKNLIDEISPLDTIFLKDVL